MYKADELTSSLLNDIGNKNVCHGGPDFLSWIIRIIFAGLFYPTSKPTLIFYLPKVIFYLLPLR